MRKYVLPLAIVVAAASIGCGDAMTDATSRLEKYATFRLTADLSSLTENQRRMIPILIEAAQEMDEIFWQQAYGNRDSLLMTIEDVALRRLVEMNYGPWDRLDGDAPLLASVRPKRPGANFYPADASRDELAAAFEADTDEARELGGLYTLVRRASGGELEAVPYHEAFAEPTARAAEHLREAAQLAADPGLRRYLELRAEALMTDDYRASDVAWMDMKSNTIDVVIGPIETYEDQLFGRKASHEAYVLIKDLVWSERLSRYTTLLPGLQRGLPVPDRYKREVPGRDSELNAYDVVYYAGEANTGAKTIAINLPNDETVQLEKGTRRLQLKNALQAKFDSILVPIAGMLIAEDQREHITFDAFFANVMFHEVAHGLGIKNTVTGRGTVREALQEHASTMEEGKADVLGIYMVTQLAEEGEWTDSDVRDNFVTFLASIFRSVRFGANDAHGRANMVQLSFLQERGAFTRDSESGSYRVDFDRMREAMAALSEVILTLQGDGDYEAVGDLLRNHGAITPQVQEDLDRLATAGIPIDIVFEQGLHVLEGS
ncbi:MAG: Zn-dependent hydrolase [Gemmatimonadetes bacterium]|nr:Zn-dependent hydrolase [Gemmatimonadota bacterium]